jgi:hypothetical protein
MRPVPRRHCWGVWTLLSLVAIGPLSIPAFAQADTVALVQPDTPQSPGRDRSPWLLAPVFNANPKLGASFGAMAGYIYYFDAKSRPTIFAVTGQYTSTQSILAGVFARMSFASDHQRVLAGALYGNIKNDYDDYLGTGVPLKNNAELFSLFARYTYRVAGNWFIGGQGIAQNFQIAGETDYDDQILDDLGLVPYKSVGLGLVVQYDSRNNENMPTQGWFLNLNNVFFREDLGGEADYDVYRLELRYYIPHGKRHVIALRQMNHLTNDAPTAARAPVQLRGYKVGQYSGEFMSSVEAEERYRFANRWTATLFAGVACLYGGDLDCFDDANVYPNVGAGIQYILKPKAGIVMNLEFAAGKNEDFGIYLKMAYAY